MLPRRSSCADRAPAGWDCDVREPRRLAVPDAALTGPGVNPAAVALLKDTAAAALLVLLVVVRGVGVGVLEREDSLEVGLNSFTSFLVTKYSGCGGGRLTGVVERGGLAPDFPAGTVSAPPIVTDFLAGSTIGVETALAAADEDGVVWSALSMATRRIHSRFEWCWSAVGCSISTSAAFCRRSSTSFMYSSRRDLWKGVDAWRLSSHFMTVSACDTQE